MGKIILYQVNHCMKTVPVATEEEDLTLVANHLTSDDGHIQSRALKTILNVKQGHTTAGNPFVC